MVLPFVVERPTRSGVLERGFLGRDFDVSRDAPIWRVDFLLWFALRVMLLWIFGAFFLFVSWYRQNSLGAAEKQTPPLWNAKRSVRRLWFEAGIAR